MTGNILGAVAIGAAFLCAATGWGTRINGGVSVVLPDCRLVIPAPNGALRENWPGSRGSTHSSAFFSEIPGLNHFTLNYFRQLFCMPAHFVGILTLNHDPNHGFGSGRS